MNSRNSSIRCSFDNISCWTKYLVNGIFFAPDANMVKTLFGFTDPNKSILEPAFRNFGENPAKGPKIKVFWQSIYVFSKDEKDMGVEQPLACPIIFHVAFLPNLD